MEFSEEVTGIWPGCRCGHALSAATDSLQARKSLGRKDMQCSNRIITGRIDEAKSRCPSASRFSKLAANWFPYKTRNCYLEKGRHCRRGSPQETTSPGHL